MKSIFKSKTFWFNVLTLIAQLLAKDDVSQATQTLLGVGQAIGNIGLRFVTAKPVAVAVRSFDDD